MSTDLLATAALLPGTQPSPYLDHPDAQPALELFTRRHNLLVLRAQFLMETGFDLVDLGALGLALERTLRDLNTTLLRISREQLIAARAAGDVPAAATALQEITNLEHILTERTRP